MQPKLTCMIPHYNDGKYLPDAIESILAQTWGDFEVLIVDDASNEENLAVVRKCASLDKRIRVIYREKNGGPGACALQASKVITTPYTHDMGADDIRYPTFFEKSVTVFEKNPQIALTWAAFNWGESPEDNTEDCGFSNCHETVFLLPDEAVTRLLQGMKLTSPCAVYRTEIGRKYGGYDPKMTYLGDWYLLSHILFGHPSAFIPEVLGYFRVRGNNYSNVARHNKKSRNNTYYYLLEKLKEEPQFREQCRKSAALVPLFHDLFWKMLFNPKYITFWPYIAKKYPVKQRIMRSLLKRFYKKVEIG